MGIPFIHVSVANYYSLGFCFRLFDTLSKNKTYPSFSKSCCFCYLARKALIRKKISEQRFYLFNKHSHIRSDTQVFVKETK